MHHAFGDRPVRLISAHDRRFLVFYLVFVFAGILYAYRLERLNVDVRHVLREQCVGANATAKVWNAVIATDITEEQRSKDPPDVKARKLAALHSFKFPIQDCGG